MKTTVEIPNDLYRRAKREAVRRRRTLNDLVEQGLRLAIKRPNKMRRRQSLFKLMKGAIGIIDSGIPDLATNPKHLEGLGRDSLGRDVEPLQTKLGREDTPSQE